MATPQQIELARKYYTQEQIDKELATPGTVKRVDALGTPQYEQMNGGQYASATKVPAPMTPPDVGQMSTGANAQGETIYNFGTPTTPTPPQIQSTLQPGSVSGILGDMGDNQFATDYYNRILQEYNAPIDEQAIYEKKRQENQAQIDAINALYADRLRQEKQTSQGRLGSSRAIQARSGLIGSDFGTAQTSGVQQLNREQEQSVENERLALVNQILSGAQKSAADEIAAKRKAREAGGKAYLDYLAGQQTRKQENTSKAAQLLLLNNKTPEDITDAELSQAKISRNDLRLVYSGLKSQQESESAKAELETQKTQAEIAKLNSDIEKGEFDRSKFYEVGNRIYEQGTNRYIGDAAFNPYSGAMQVTPGNQVYNPVTGQFTQAPTTGQGATGDLRIYRSQYPNEAWSGTNNPGGITVNPTFTQTLKNAGINVESSSPRPASEGGSYYVFPTIEEGMKAYNLLWQSPNYQNITVGQALKRWGTDSLPGVDNNKKVSQLSPEEFQNLQMAQIRKESPGLYRVMTSGGGATGGGYDEGKLALMQSITTLTPTTIKALAGAGLTPEDWAKFNDGQLPPTNNQAKQAENIVAQIDSFLNDPALQRATGTSSYGNVIPGTKARDFQKRFDTFVATLVLPNLGQLKGPMSDKDIQFLKDTASALSTNMSEAGFKSGLEQLKLKYQQILAKGGGTAPPPIVPSGDDAYAQYLKSIGQ